MDVSHTTSSLSSMYSIDFLTYMGWVFRVRGLWRHVRLQLITAKLRGLGHLYGKKSEGKNKQTLLNTSFITKQTMEYGVWISRVPLSWEFLSVLYFSISKYNNYGFMKLKYKTIRMSKQLHTCTLYCINISTSWDNLIP